MPRKAGGMMVKIPKKRMMRDVSRRLSPKVSVPKIPVGIL